MARGRYTNKARGNGSRHSYNNRNGSGAALHRVRIPINATYSTAMLPQTIKAMLVPTMTHIVQEFPGHDTRLTCRCGFELGGPVQAGILNAPMDDQRIPFLLGHRDGSDKKKKKK